MISGVRPVVCGLKKEELQAVRSDVALATPAVTAQIAQLSGFDVADYVPHGEPVDQVVDLNVVEQMIILVDVTMVVVGKETESVDSWARVEVLRNALQKGLQTVRLHAKYTKDMRIPSNSKRVGTLVNDDLMNWTSELFDVAISAGAKWTSPPDVGLKPPVLVPHWEKLNACIDAGGLMNVEAHRGRAQTRTSPFSLTAPPSPFHDA